MSTSVADLADLGMQPIMLTQHAVYDPSAVSTKRLAGFLDAFMENM